MKKRLLKNMDWGILICCIVLVLIGLVALMSATQDTEYEEFIKQIQWFLISIPILIIVICIDYELIARISPVLYIIFIALLIGVLFTEPINGASSWFDLKVFQFQPAEFAKIIVIIFLAYAITKVQERRKDEINNPLKLGLILLITLIPVALIIKQPDYGTACAFLVATVFMIYAAGIKKRYIISALAIVVIIVPIAYFYILPDHAKKRIDVYLNPESDPRGAGYNIIQSKLAIGAGELVGMGVLKGNQTQLGFLYPKTTDFIFSVIGEEMGFIVTSSIVLLYVTLIVKAIYIAKTAKDELGSYIAVGIARNIYVSHDGKHRNDNRTSSNNRSTTTVFKLWWKLNDNKLYINRFITKHKWKTSKSNIYRIIGEKYVLKQIKNR